MNRRGFLSLLGMAAPALVLDPERLLWVPGAKTFFLPSAAPTLASLPRDLVDDIRIGPRPLSSDWIIKAITKEALRMLESNLAFSREINRRYDDQFPRPGATIGIQIPARFAQNATLLDDGGSK